MFLTEREILDTPAALERTCRYFEDRLEEHKGFFARNPYKKFAFLGCGSSYMLAKSAAAVFGGLPKTTAQAIAAGDYLVAPGEWRESLKDSIVVALSRSGRTSELVLTVQDIRETLGCPVVSICAKEQNDLTALSGMNIVLDWCYDNSVCQTRTVTNFYAAALLLAAAYSGDAALGAAVHAACARNAAFQQKNRPVLEKTAALDWDNVVVLADGPLCGIAEEGALAFTEISMLCGRYFHLLDYRHGPIVISNERTLTVMVLRPGEQALQKAMVGDVLAQGGPVVTLSDQPGNPWGSTINLQIEGLAAFAAWGIPFIYTAQALALCKAVLLGGNPDAPKGLDAYITLK